MITWDMIALCCSMLLAACAVAVAMLTFSRRRAVGRGDSATPRHAGDNANDAPIDAAREVCRDLRELMAQLQRLAGRIDADVEQRLEQLRQALSQADDRLSQLREMIELEKQSPRALRGKRSVKVGDGAGLEILRLSHDGLDSVEIARQMNMDVGEVELVLRLHRSSPAGQARE